MNRSQLEHAIRAACDIADDDEIYVFGSQAILGQYPEAPVSLRSSMEVDVAPKNKPEAWEHIDGSIGELSMFHDTFGFYVQGLEIEAALLPAGWESRCIRVTTQNATGLCLECHDLALSKLAAYREKDRDFVRTLFVEALLSGDALVERLPTLPLDSEAKRPIIEQWIRATMRELDLH